MKSTTDSRSLYRATVAVGVAVALLAIANTSGASEVVPSPTLEQADETDAAEVDERAERVEARRARVQARHRAKRTLRGDLNRGWFHIGGGFGATVIEPESNLAVRSGRFVLGGGRYVPFFYGGGGVEITGHELEPFKLTGVAYLGLAIPVPVVHPLIGLRVGGGHHLSDGEMRPHVSVGPQAGIIVRQFDGKVGMRVMVDAGIDYRIEEREIDSEFFITLAMVF
jgi:hypothetical protein